MEPWNDSSLQPPPIHTTPAIDNIIHFDVKRLSQICNNIVNILSKQSPLHKESAIVSRLVYKFDKKFRNDIGYRCFKKVNTALQKYLLVNLLKDVENFKNVLPSEDDEYFPTKQMLEYILVRLLTFSKIMLRICVLSKQAAIFYLDRVKRGESHWMCLMPYALLCRIWSMSLVLLKHATQWYTSLYPYLNNLVLKGFVFLPNNYKLPENIDVWLDLENIENIGRLDWTQKKKNIIDLSMDDDNSFENLLEYVNQINDEPKKQIPTSSENLKKADIEQLQTPKPMKVDHGETISRESFNILSNFQRKLENTTYVHDFKNVKDITSLKDFLENEEMFRNEKNKLSLTSHLSFMQWQALKISSQRIYKPLSRNKNVDKKFLKIWKEKCLDYL